MAYGPGNIPCAGGPGELQRGHNANDYIWRTVCRNFARGFPLETVTKFTHSLKMKMKTEEDKLKMKKIKICQ
jgi:hypothetical protein